MTASLRVRAVPKANARIAIGLALSIVLHVLIVTNVNLRAPSVLVPGGFPLQVRIENLANSAADGQMTNVVTRDNVEVAASGAFPGKLAQQPEPNPRAEADVEAGLQLPLDKYFTAKELDVRANQINEVPLLYPSAAYEMRLRGRVVLRVFINEDGGVDAVSIVEATPRGAFEEATLSAARDLRFSSAWKNGHIVKSQKTLEVTFDPYEETAR